MRLHPQLLRHCLNTGTQHLVSVSRVFVLVRLVFFTTIKCALCAINRALQGIIITMVSKTWGLGAESQPPEENPQPPKTNGKWGRRTLRLGIFTIFKQK